MRTKKGSSKIRKILRGKPELTVSPNISKYAELTEIIINNEGSGLLNSCWGFSYLKNDFRTFIFKLHSNILGINSRVAHYVRGHPNTCTFCDLTREPEEHSETILHLFFECRHTEKIIEEFYRWLRNREIGYMPTRSEFFCNFELECSKQEKTLLIVNLIVKKYIWDCKLRFTVPNTNALKNIFINEINLIIRQSPTMKKTMEQSAVFANINEIRF
jgi:hypothetical protein